MRGAAPQTEAALVKGDRNKVLYSVIVTLILTQSCKNHGRQVAMATKFCTVAPNICGSSVRDLLQVSLVVPRILWWLLIYWKNFAPYINLPFTEIGVPQSVSSPLCTFFITDGACDLKNSFSVIWLLDICTRFPTAKCEWRVPLRAEVSDDGPSSAITWQPGICAPSLGFAT